MVFWIKTEQRVIRTILTKAQRMASLYIVLWTLRPQHENGSGYIAKASIYSFISYSGGKKLSLS